MIGKSLFSATVATFSLTLPTALPQASEPVLLRTSLLVKDAEVSVRFYELLGFRTETEMSSPRQPEGNFFPVNAPSTRTRLVIMASASGNGGRIGLVEFSDPEPADNRLDAKRTGIGDVVLVFDVTDAEVIHGRLRDAGVTIIEPPQVYLSRKIAPDGLPMRGRVFHVKDPDDYLIELLEAPQPITSEKSAPEGLIWR